MKIITYSSEETIAFAKDFCQTLKPNSVLLFSGDLATGKTTFIKGIVSELTEVPIDQIMSPTFVYLNIYEGKIPVFHFDLYRLHGVDEFLSMGFDEYFSAEGICCIEWVDRIGEMAPKDSFSIKMEHLPNGGREIYIENNAR